MSRSDQRSFRDLSLWLLVSTTAQFANPFVEFGWPELLASTGPLVVGLDRRIRPVPTAILGAGLICGLGLISREGRLGVWTFVAPLCFVIGVVLAARAFASRSRAAPVSGSWAGQDSTPGAREAFAVRLERELGRARRYGKLLVLLSVAPADDSARSAVDLRRALPAIAHLLSRELRLYADGLIDDGRVLALVPELEHGAFDVFVKRVRTALEQRLDFEVDVGIAVFPTDAICSEDLVEEADFDRDRARARSAGPSASEPAFSEPRVSQREVPL